MFLLVLSAVATAFYAFVNAFGAWMVIRRKPWVAGLFMLAAAMLVVAAAALVTAIPFTRVLLVVGLVLASLSSLLNAQVVIGQVVWRNHLARALVALGIYMLANWAL